MTEMHRHLPGFVATEEGVRGCRFQTSSPAYRTSYGAAQLDVTIRIFGSIMDSATFTPGVMLRTLVRPREDFTRSV